MHTKKYNHLQKRLRMLKRVYLPHSFSKTGEYSDTVLEKTRAYTVLVHAEMEYYFEQIALEIAEKAFTKWETSKRTSRPLLALVAYYTGQYQSLPELHTGNRAHENINEKIKMAYTSYNKQIRASNNGIKETNILSIFLPIGVVIENFDENLFIALSNFGSKRGEIAHSTKAQTLSTPDDAYAEVENLLSLIDPFDQFISHYRSAI